MIKTQLTVHLGITGHCNLPAAYIPRIRESLRTVFRCVKQDVESIRAQQNGFLNQVELNGVPVYRLISSLAKGADTVAAQEALEMGYRLQVSLPFTKDTYATDFAEGTERDTYEQLLNKAESVFEIAIGKKGEHSAPAYADASTVMLCHSDILIAVWDGKRTEQQAGTYATIREAKKSRIPVIIIPCEQPESIRFEITGRHAQSWEEELHTHLQTILLPATKQEAIEAKAKPAKFFQYWWGGYNITIANFFNLNKKESAEPLLFPIPQQTPRKKPETVAEKLRDFFPSLVRESSFRNLFIRDIIAKEKSEKNKPENQAKEKETKEALCPVLPCETSWSGFRNEALYGAGNYYGESIKNHLYQQYFLPVVCMLSVIIALNFNNFGIGNAIRHLSNGHIGIDADLILSCILLVVQLISLVSLVLLFSRDNTEAEHSRHITYRLLSERCRLAIAVSASGFCRIFSPMKEWGEVHWVDWYYRLLARTNGLPNQQGEQAVTRDYLCKWLNRLAKGFLSSQESYHKKRLKKDSRVNQVLHTLALIFFKASLYTSLSRIVLSLAYSHALLPEQWFFIIPILGCLMLIFPCLGMFFAAYANYANYPSQITVSTAMEQTCKILKEEAEELQKTPDLRFRDVLELCVSLEDRCAGEVSDWESNHNHDKSWER